MFCEGLTRLLREDSRLTLVGAADAGGVARRPNLGLKAKQERRDESLTVAQVVSQAAGRIGENLVIRRFVRWERCPDNGQPATGD